MANLTPHINAELGDFAKIVIIPHFPPLFNKKWVISTQTLHFFNVKLPLQAQKNFTTD